jgi:hypothetical protein
MIKKGVNDHCENKEEYVPNFSEYPDDVIRRIGALNFLDKNLKGLQEAHLFEYQKIFEKYEKIIEENMNQRDLIIRGDYDPQNEEELAGWDEIPFKQSEEMGNNLSLVDKLVPEKGVPLFWFKCLSHCPFINFFIYKRDICFFFFLNIQIKYYK